MTANATELESVEITSRNNTLRIAGTGLSDVVRITITDPLGEEVELSFIARGRTPTLIAPLGDFPPGTYRLRLFGATRNLLDQIALGVPPPARAVLTGALRRVVNTETCQSTACTVTVSCPTGYLVMGGGFEQTGYYDTRTVANRPDSPTAWRVSVEALNANAYFTSARGYAVCLRGEP